MTDTRDMEGIAKLNLLADALGATALEHYKEFHEEFNKQSSNPACMLEWGGKLFENAANWKFYMTMANICRTAYDNRVKEGKPVDCTMGELVEQAKRHFRPRGLHHSSSASSNLMASYMDEVVLDFMFDGGWRYQWFRTAQRQDPEFQAWWAQEAEKLKAEADMKAAIAAQTARDKEAARNRTRAEMKRGNLPYTGDLLTGWPNLADINSVRNDELRMLIRKAHDHAARKETVR